ncbi:MAG: diacylglycerol kinase family protein [Armatimonadia bacterium]
MLATLIANPAARLVESVISLDDVVHCLQGSGLELDVRQTAEPGDARRFAAEAVAAGVPRVIAAGGDGTINEVIQSLANTGTELAIVPLGTGNVIARYAGLDDRQYTTSCNVAAAGKVVTIDLGLMDGRYFLATAGAGIDAQVTLNLDSWWKQRLGKIAFVTEFFRSMLMQEPSTFRVTVDQQVIEGPMWGVLICNTNEFSWRLRPAPEAREDDGLLDVVFIHRQGFLDFLDLAVRMFFAGETAAGHPTATVVRAGSMHIESNPPVPWQVEGEPLGMTPVSVQVVPKGLKLVVSG